MPVATQAAIKGLTPQQTEALGITLMLNNTFVIMLSNFPEARRADVGWESSGII
jgi:tRNA-guanine family transglycosylase